MRTVAAVMGLALLWSASAAEAQERAAPGSQVLVIDASGPTPDAMPVGAEAPSDARVHTEPRWAVFGGGVAVFGVSYLSMLVASLTAASATPAQTGLELAAIPWVGPFLVLDHREAAFAVGLVLDGVGQLAGLAMAIAGLADGQRVASPRAGEVSLRGGRLTLTF